MLCRRVGFKLSGRVRQFTRGRELELDAEPRVHHKKMAFEAERAERVTNKPKLCAEDHCLLRSSLLYGGLLAGVRGRP